MTTSLLFAVGYSDVPGHGVIVIGQGNAALHWRQDQTRRNVHTDVVFSKSGDSGYVSASRAGRGLDFDGIQPSVVFENYIDFGARVGPPVVQLRARGEDAALLSDFGDHGRFEQGTPQRMPADGRGARNRLGSTGKTGI